MAPVQQVNTCNNHIISKLSSSTILKVAKEYGIDPTTLRRWRRDYSNIAKCGKSSADVKRLRTPSNSKVNEAVYSWYTDMRDKGLPVSGPMIQAKARILCRQFGGELNFTASDGWLTHWKTKFGVRKLSLLDEKPSANKPTAPKFIQKIVKSIGASDIPPTIDDAVETELNLMERQVNIEEIKKRISRLNLAIGNVTNSDNASSNHERRNNLSGPEGKVLVLYTGGTIGMVRNDKGALAPIPNIFVDTVKNYPYLHDRAYANEKFGNSGSLVLPITGSDNRRIIYDVLEYSPLLDSSNMTMDNWIKIANDIRESYELFDGFVVLHGTDTLSYTASALSFMLEALGKTVVITGSQLPIFDSRSDGLSNFLTSLVIAGNHNIPEVCVFFGTQLMRGNRTSKVASASFEAFSSPNCSPLAIAGIKIEVDYHSIFRQSALEKFHVHKTLNRNVGLLRIFPSITADLVKAFVQPPTAGVVLQTYGAGNIPANREDIIEVLREASKRGVIIVSITQCSKGGVTDLYESGKLLLEVGITPGSDMTPEAALTKLAYVLSKTDWDISTKRHMMRSNLRGELTSCSVNGQFCQVEDSDLIKTVSLRGDGVDVSQPNGDGRTILHLACCEGDIKIVRTLLEMGANVHIQDRFNRTPLTEAVENDFHEIINLLLQCGAHLHESSLVLGEKLCSAAAHGNLKRLQSLHLAGANLSLADTSGRTALHYAALHDRTASVQFLLEHGADPKCVDLLGHTPHVLAQISGAKNIEKTLDTASKNIKLEPI